MMDGKSEVREFWNKASCGEDLYLANTEKAGYRAHSDARYALEGLQIEALARFEEGAGKHVLEIGVGLGADHQRWAESGATLKGIDLTERAVEHTRRRLQAFGLHSDLAVGDAEQTGFTDASFDIVYSWGVLHHSPDTPKAIGEVHRILKPGGSARIMIYHKWSTIGFMLWVRYALLALRPWRSLAYVYANHLESPGTKAYSVAEARRLFAAFRNVDIATKLGHQDLLESAVGQRHRGPVLVLARVLWPRWLIRRLFPDAGLFMTIEATK